MSLKGIHADGLDALQRHVVVNPDQNFVQSKIRKRVHSVTAALLKGRVSIHPMLRCLCHTLQAVAFRHTPALASTCSSQHFIHAKCTCRSMLCWHLLSVMNVWLSVDLHLHWPGMTSGFHISCDLPVQSCVLSRHVYSEKVHLSVVQH